mmetsp:Transcript_8329/g.24823  ORF Transcript_8329/g.24823 Transcript_8329/m.24823 type:complete len:481 (-) Transcript_8329:456-1898(-)
MDRSHVPEARAAVVARGNKRSTLERERDAAVLVRQLVLADVLRRRVERPVVDRLVVGRGREAFRRRVPRDRRDARGVVPPRVLDRHLEALPSEVDLDLAVRVARREFQAVGRPRERRDGAAVRRQRRNLRQRPVEDPDRPVLGADGEAVLRRVRGARRRVVRRRLERLDAGRVEDADALGRGASRDVSQTSEGHGLALDRDLRRVRAGVAEADLVVEAPGREARGETDHGGDFAAVRRAADGTRHRARDLRPLLPVAARKDRAVVAARHDRPVSQRRHRGDGRLGRLDDLRRGAARRAHVQVVEVAGQREREGPARRGPGDAHLHVRDVFAHVGRRQKRARVDVPDAEPLVRAARQELGPVGRVRAGVDRPLRALFGVRERPERRAFLALVDHDLLVAADGRDRGAVGGVTDAVDVVAVLRARVVELERRALVEDALEVFGAGHDPERPLLAVGDGNDLLLVADHLANAVARVPHDALAS